MGARWTLTTIAMLCGWQAALPERLQACEVVLKCDRSRTLPAEGGHLPANMQALYWRPPCRTADPKPRLEATTPDGATRQIEIDVQPSSWQIEGSGGRQVRWREQLDPGTQLAFSFDVVRETEPPYRQVIQILVSEPAEVPSELGPLLPTRGLGTFLLASYHGDCTHFVQAEYVDLRAGLYDAQPWADALGYETFVDDAPWKPYREHYGQSKEDEWIGGSALGRDRERVFLACDVPGHSTDQWLDLASLIEPGEHTARMIAHLPDGTEIASQPYTFTLECPVSLPDAGIAEFLERPPADAGTRKPRPVAQRASCSANRPRPAANGGARPWAALLALLLCAQLVRRARGRRRDQQEDAKTRSGEL